MKKYTIYIGILTVGLLLGWLLFGGTSNNETEHNHDAVTETNQMYTCACIHRLCNQNQVIALYVVCI